MKHEEKDQARERILQAASDLFSKKGYDATRVNEIAETAEVNKALIYYYFENKEAILDHLLQTLFTKFSQFAMEFIKQNVVKMIDEGRLDIEATRYHFTTQQDLNVFLDAIRGYYDGLVGFAIKHRSVIRIMLVESLKNNKHHYDLFSFLNLMEKSNSNSLFKTIHEADSDFDIPDSTVNFKFFFALIPILNFAAYYDDWKEMRGATDKQLREGIKNSMEILIQSFVSGQDILIK